MAGKVIPLTDGSYLVRGYMTEEEAVAIIREECDPDFDLDRYCRVEQCHMRAIPDKAAQKAGDYDYRYEHSKPGRGAFACTAVWV